MKVINVVITANRYSSTPTANPIADVTHRLDAVVIPTTFSRSAIIVPAPIKPIPATIPAAILAGSIPKSKEMIVNRHEPRQTSICVLKPAGL